MSIPQIDEKTDTIECLECLETIKLVKVHLGKRMDELSGLIHSSATPSVIARRGITRLVIVLVTDLCSIVESTPPDKTRLRKLLAVYKYSNSSALDTFFYQSDRNKVHDIVFDIIRQEFARVELGSLTDRIVSPTCLAILLKQYLSSNDSSILDAMKKIQHKGNNWRYGKLNNNYLVLEQWVESKPLQQIKTDSLKLVLTDDSSVPLRKRLELLELIWSVFCLPLFHELVNGSPRFTRKPFPKKSPLTIKKPLPYTDNPNRIRKRQLRLLSEQVLSLHKRQCLKPSTPSSKISEVVPVVSDHLDVDEKVDEKSPPIIDKPTTTAYLTVIDTILMGLHDMGYNACVAELINFVDQGLIEYPAEKLVMIRRRNDRDPSKLLWGDLWGSQSTSRNDKLKKSITHLSSTFLADGTVVKAFYQWCATTIPLLLCNMEMTLIEKGHFIGMLVAWKQSATEYLKHNPTATTDVTPKVADSISAKIWREIWSQLYDRKLL